MTWVHSYETGPQHMMSKVFSLFLYVVPEFNNTLYYVYWTWITTDQRTLYQIITQCARAARRLHLHMVNEWLSPHALEKGCPNSRLGGQMLPPEGIHVACSKSPHLAWRGEELCTPHLWMGSCATKEAACTPSLREMLVNWFEYHLLSVLETVYELIWINLCKFCL